MVFGLSRADQPAQFVRPMATILLKWMGGIPMFPAFAETTSGGRLFHWNLDGSVGLLGANRFDDVMFVQWCLYKAAKWDGLDRVAKVTGRQFERRSPKRTSMEAAPGCRPTILLRKSPFFSR
jgi:hypothetical protein